jgi:hypothetical protein
VPVLVPVPVLVVVLALLVCVGPWVQLLSCAAEPVPVVGMPSKPARPIASS